MTRREFDRAFERHYTILVKVATCAGATDPYEAVHMTWDELVRGGGYRQYQPRGRASIQTWMIAAVLRRVIRARRPGKVIPSARVPVERETPESVERRIDLESALTVLPPARADLVRRYLRGESTRDLARAAGVTVSTVTKDLTRARSAMRAALIRAT